MQAPHNTGVSRTDDLLSRIDSSDATVRYAAWRSAADADPDAIGPLADRMASSDLGVAKAARGALEVIVHASGGPDRANDRRKVSSGLLTVATDPARPERVRGHALHLIAYIGDAQVVTGVSTLLTDPAVRDEARMALEQIRGRESVHALESAARTVPDDFKPSLEQSVRARKLSSRTVGAEGAGR